MDEKYYPRNPHASGKEIAMSILLCLGMWTVSLTILVPFFLLLAVSSWLQKKFYTFLMRPRSERPRNSTNDHHRIYLFNQMRASLQECGPLKILELGVGMGMNFPFYKAEDSLTLLDVNPNFQSIMEAELEKYPDVKVEKFIVAKAEDMKDVESESYDAVLCTYLLCSVSDVKKVMVEVKRVLKFGGKFAFMEHIGYPRNHVGYWIQKAISPVLSVYCCGCHVDRFFMDSIDEIFSRVFFQIVYPVSYHMLIRPHVIVLATK